MFSVMKKGCKTIVVSSASPNEGKTTTTINLAITFSQADQKVLLIDGDLRKPKIHHYFSIPNTPGLTNYLGSTVSSSRRDRVDLYDVIRPTDFPNLSILSSGSIPPNPAELLGSELMANFLEEISKDFDYIIIDTPPINVVSDALPLIREADGVVLIVRQNHTTHPDIQRALASLEFIDAKILGFVVNFAGENTGGKYGYGAYRYGGKYNRYDNYGGYGYGGYNGYGYGGYGGYGYGGYGSYGGYNGYSGYDSDSQGINGAIGVNLNRTPNQDYYRDPRNND
jgi:capsular exopolysaccharide synthesis family protein